MTNNNQIDIEKKTAANLNGDQLSQTLSIFIYNSDYQLLTQRLTKTKYRSGSLLTSTVYGHPRSGEDIEAAAHRSLKKEVGFDTALAEKCNFIYRAELENGLTEGELNYVFIGRYNGSLDPNSQEIEKYRWILIDELCAAAVRTPELLAPQFKIILRDHLDKIY